MKKLILLLGVSLVAAIASAGIITDSLNANSADVSDNASSTTNARLRLDFSSGAQTNSLTKW